MSRFGCLALLKHACYPKPTVKILIKKSFYYLPIVIQQSFKNITIKYNIGEFVAQSDYFTTHIELTIIPKPDIKIILVYHLAAKVARIECYNQRKWFGVDGIGTPYVTKFIDYPMYNNICFTPIDSPFIMINTIFPLILELLENADFMNKVPIVVD